MSVKHPIISVTGSSGAGTTSVRRTFEQIFRRENVEAAYIEGDAFHRCNRLEIPNLVFHPGSHVGSGEEAGMDRIGENLNRASSRPLLRSCSSACRISAARTRASAARAA